MITELFIFANQIYGDIPIASRIAAIGWIMYISIYYFINYYEKLNNLKKDREYKQRNYPFTLYFMLIFCFLHDYIQYSNGIIFSYGTFKIGEYVIVLQFLGFVIMCVGFITVMEARARLNGLWGGAIYDYKEQNTTLITTGVYNIVRHPMYLGQLIMFFGTTLLLDNYVLLIWLAFAIIGNIVRAKREEVDLLDRFGDEYIEYKNKTPFFVGIIT